MPTLRIFVRTAALSAIFLMASAGGGAEHIQVVEGCPTTCESMSAGVCFGGWPDEQTCQQHIHDVCEIVLSNYGPDCERACQVADGICTVDEDECQTSQTGELWLECQFEIRDAI
jgi:hypothetical protein